MKKISNNKKILTAISCASLIVILLVWWLYCDVFKLVPNAVFPGPDKVINTFITKLYSKKPEGATIFDHAFAGLLAGLCARCDCRNTAGNHDGVE